MKKYSYFLCLLIAIGLTACEDKDAIDAISPVKGVWMHDLDNKENASDLLVYFVLSEEKASKEFRIVLAKESPETPITGEYLASLDASAYTTVSSNSELAYKVNLKQNQVDSDGDPLTYDKSYVAHVFYVESKAFSSAEDPLHFKNNPIYEGKYKGVWEDNLFSNIAISCTITSNTAGVYRGPFYISSNFTPNWGAAEDNGDFEIKVDDGVILDFKYSQHAPDYRGGCPGTYNGTGMIDDNYNLTLNFTGDDCDGHHTDGLMTLRRVWGDK